MNVFIFSAFLAQEGIVFPSAQKAFRLFASQKFAYQRNRPNQASHFSMRLGRFRRIFHDIHFDGTTGNSRGVVRHELCHIYYKDFPRRLTSWREWISYLLIEEPLAAWCSLGF